MRETKSIQSKADAQGRTVTGICSVFGNVDDWGDRMHPGSFAKTISEGRSRAKHLWNHDFSKPPIASIKELREVSREELPGDILAFAPEATGGLLVKREYYVSNELSEMVFEAIKSGDVCEMSFGFDATKFDFTENEGKQIRELREVRLYDTSDVLWGMNNSTLASGAKHLFGMSPEIYLANLPLAVAEYQNNLKAGRRNSTQDAAIISTIHESLIKLGFDGCELKTTDEKSTGVTEAEAVKNDTSLRQAQAILASLKTQKL
jgi:HK97 family phage prohead protease